MPILVDTLGMNAPRVGFLHWQINPPNGTVVFRLWDIFFPPKNVPPTIFSASGMNRNNWLKGNISAILGHLQGFLPKKITPRNIWTSESSSDPIVKLRQVPSPAPVVDPSPEA